MGIEPDGSFESLAKQKAETRNWKFEKVQGSMGMFQRLVNGDWDQAEFLVIPPGCRVATTYDDGIIGIEKQP